VDRTREWGWRRQGVYTVFWEEYLLKTREFKKINMTIFGKLVIMMGKGAARDLEFIIGT